MGKKNSRNCEFETNGTVNSIALFDDMVLYADGGTFVIADKEDWGEYDAYVSPVRFNNIAEALGSLVNRSMNRKLANGEVTTMKQYIKEEKRLQEKLDKLIGTDD